MPSRLVSSLALIGATALAACTTDPMSPSTTGRPATASALLSPGEGVRVISDSMDVFGNTILVQEFGIGVYTLPTGESGTVASVVIQSILPGPSTPITSKTCLTHSIVRTETTPGNTLTIKKSGGCNKDIEIQVEQAVTRLKATFRFSMVPGKTVIDSGLLR